MESGLGDGAQDSRADGRTVGLLAFNQLRKQDSRDKLLAAAVRLFCKAGYGAVGIEDITAEAGVSRVTFYRHFAGKAALALELFRQAAADGAPRMLAIAARDWHDRATVRQWLWEFFEGIARSAASCAYSRRPMSRRRAFRRRCTR